MKLREGSLTALACGCVARCGEVTCDGAEEAECGRVALVLVDHPLGGGHGHGDGEGDRLVELAPPGLVLQKNPSEANPKVHNHGEGPY